jgi:hypothetical protein
MGFDGMVENGDTSNRCIAFAWGALFALALAATAAAGADTEPPTVSAVLSDSEVEVGENVAFVGSAQDGGTPVTNPLLYNWSFAYNGSVQTLHGQTPSFRFWVPGNYTVTLHVDDAAGNGNQTSVVLTVREKPAAPPAAGGTGHNATTGGALPGLEAVGAVAAVGALTLARRRSKKP